MIQAHSLPLQSAFVNVPNRGMAAFDRMRCDVIGELDTSDRRQEAAIIKAFE